VLLDVLPRKAHAGAAVTLAGALALAASPAWAQTPAPSATPATPPPAPKAAPKPKAGAKPAPAPAPDKSAASAPAAPPSATDKAAADELAKIVADAQKAVAALKWEDARVLYAKAYKLKPGWIIEAELGRAEAGAGKFRDGAEHLAGALRDAPASLTADDRKTIEDSLDDARAHVATLTVNVRPGAEVLIGGQSVGTAPLPGPLYLDPGQVVIEARLDGYMGMRAPRNLAAGANETVDLKLLRAGGADIPPPAAASTEGALSNVKLPIVFGGAAGSALFTILGTTFAIVSDTKSSSSHALEQPTAATKCMGKAVNAAACNAQVASLGTQFDALQKAKVNFAGASMWSFIGAGALLVGTGAYLVVSLVKKPGQDVKAGVVLGPDRAGAVLTYEW
jgi:hypothetical protein